MTPYDQLKQIIQQANPEIMELKFGCELEGGFVYSWSNGPLVWIISLHGRGSQMQIPKEHLNVYKPLGRPIRLADVLLAIKGHNYLVDEFGMFWYFTKGGNPHYEVDYKDAKAEWNLKDDNLDHQSDETKEFLIKLLIK